MAVTRQDDGVAATGSTRAQHDPGAPRTNPGEARYAAGAAILTAVLLYLLLPNHLIVGPRWVVPALELALFVPLVVANPHRFTRETVPLRALSIGLVALITVANMTAFVRLVDALVSGQLEQGRQLLLGAAQVWITNMIAFALAYWELDRGGPVARALEPHDQLPPADFRFPQDEDHDAIAEVAARSAKHSDWSPGFVDYLYVSITNSSAFSPTDTLPLSHRAKMVMSVQSLSALVLMVIVIARGVNVLQ
jgi:hypothetical protein